MTVDQEPDYDDTDDGMDDADDVVAHSDRPDRTRTRREGPRSVRPEPEPLRFGGDEERDKTGDHRTFVLVDVNDQPLTEPLDAYRCKQWMLIKIAQAEGQDQVDLFLDEVMDPDSADYLRDRFDDPKDDLDVDHLAPAIEGLVGLWYGRPTGRQQGSSRQRRNARSGRRSTVRRR